MIARFRAAGSSLDAISLTASRGDQSLAEFFSDAENMDIQQVGKRILIFIEKVLVEFRSRYHLAAMHGQILEDSVFPRC
jgi:hypothetical protein